MTTLNALGANTHGTAPFVTVRVQNDPGSGCRGLDGVEN